ncbi:hypothetical protein [Sulfitobacter pacificus]|uniref:hypothetical protein n=1 Tax=Sulfitobacter pacificus TaxID=1499314 RepID=UPI00333EE982
MTTIEILHNTLHGILRNWQQALRIFLVPLGVLVGLIVCFMSFGTKSVLIDGQTVSVPSPFLFLLFPAIILLVLWPVIAWHRLLVLNEATKGYVPSFRLKCVLWYLLYLVGLGLLLALVTLPLLAALGPTMLWSIDHEAVINGKMLPPQFFIFQALISLPAIYLGIRFCLILPSAAVEDQVGIFDSWRYTRKMGTAAVALAILSAVVSLILQVALIAAAPILMEANGTGSMVIQIGQLAGQLLSSLFVISLMSTMFVSLVRNKG